MATKPFNIPTPGPLSGVDIAGLDLLVKDLVQRVNHLTNQVNHLQQWADTLTQTLNDGPLSALEIDGNGNLRVLGDLHVSQGNDIILE